ncbi:MAG TPA: hypothetical protein VF457_06890 [Burkholderiaceae bacterium]
MPAPFRLPAAWLALVAAPAFAAHPLQTEDTGTQGTGQVEIEDGLQRAVTAGASVATWQPQVSVGLAETVDAIVQPSWVSMRAAGTPGECGEGDANLDAKWRFAEGGAWSLAVRAGLELPTAQRGLGLPRGHAGQHALLALTWDAASTLLHLNLGVSHAPADAGARATLGHASAAVMGRLDARTVLALDAGVDQDPVPGRRAWLASALGGVIITVRPGLDLDAGYRLVAHAGPGTRDWLAGVTWRFGL